MSKMLVAVAGGVIGSIFGMPQLGFLVGSLLGTLLFPDSAARGGPKLTDVHVTASTYGAAIQWGFGTLRVGGNIIWAGDLVQHAHSQSGGKGLGGASSYTYSWTGGIALCSTEYTGPIKKVLKIWADTKLVYDSTGQSGVTKNIPGNGGGGKGGGHHAAGQPVVNGNTTNAYNKLGHFRVYTGTQDQMPDAALENLVGAENAQAHRGMAYIVMDDIDLENYGNRVPNFTFEVQFQGEQEYSQNAFGFDFTGTTLGTPVTDIIAIDTFRQRAYFQSHKVSGTNSDTGIYAMSLRDGSLVMERTWDSVLGSVETLTRSPAGYWVVGNDGYLYIWSDEANYGPMLKIDVDAMKIVGHIGTANSFESKGGSVTAPRSIVPVRVGYSNGLIVFGSVFKDITFLNTDVLLPMMGSTIFADLHGEMCGGNQIDNNSAEAFLLGFPTFGAGHAGPLNVYSVIIDGTVIATADEDTPPPDLPISFVGAVSPSDVDSEWTLFADCSYFVFDATDGNVMFFVRSADSGLTLGHHYAYLIKVSTQDGSILWKSSYERSDRFGDNLPGNPDAGQYQTIISTGRFSVLNGNNSIFTYETQAGGLTITDWPSQTTAGYQGWNDAIGALVVNGIRSDVFDGWGVLVTNAARQGTALSTIVDPICKAVGFEDADLDLTALTDTCEGYLLKDQMSAHDALMPLGLAFLFDGVESDDVLKFVVRGAASVVTIPSSALSMVSKDTGEWIQETRAQEIDLPRGIALTFLDLNHNYQPATQYARRPTRPFPTMYSTSDVTQSFPIVAEPETMKQLAEKLLFTTWVERVSYKAMIAWDFILLDPTDTVTLQNVDGSETVTRLTTINVGTNLTMETQHIAQDETTYSSSTGAYGGDGFIQQTLVPTTPTKLFLLDMPLLRDSDDTGQSYFILYDAASGYGSSWAGGQLFTSKDDTNFDPSTVFISTAKASWGVTVNALGDTARPYSVDHTNTIVVQMVEGSNNLANCTLLEACNGANAAAVYNTATGVIEVIQFLNVTANADTSYTLSNLLRGRRGTEVFTGTHVSGETFILLNQNDGTIQGIKQTLADVGVVRFYKAPAVGTLIEAVDPTAYMVTGRAWKPYAPVHVTAEIAGSDIALSWVRRTRVGGELKDLTGDVPLAEQSEVYEVDIYNALGDTVLRTLRVEYGATPTTSPGLKYLAADITTDFGTPPGTLNVAVFQLSTMVGRGFGVLKNVSVVTPSPGTARYYGASASTSLTEAAVIALSNVDSEAGFSLSFVYDCTGGKYPYFAFPSAYGTPTAVQVNGLPFSDFTVSIVSVAGVSYNVLRFVNIQSGAAIPVVWA